MRQSIMVVAARVSTTVDGDGGAELAPRVDHGYLTILPVLVGLVTALILVAVGLRIYRRVRRVSFVIVRGTELLRESFRGEAEPGAHAEFGLLERLKEVDLEGTTVYTTIEPCSRRGPDKQPCAERLVERRVSIVFIGMFDPNPKIYREGWKLLRDAGVNLRDFEKDLREQVRADNATFVELFQVGIGVKGSAAFDYKQNAGGFDLFPDESRRVKFHTRWTPAGSACSRTTTCPA